MAKTIPKPTRAEKIKQGNTKRQPLNAKPKKLNKIVYNLKKFLRPYRIILTDVASLISHEDKINNVIAPVSIHYKERDTIRLYYYYNTIFIKTGLMLNQLDLQEETKQNIIYLSEICFKANFPKNQDRGLVRTITYSYLYLIISYYDTINKMFNPNKEFFKNIGMYCPNIPPVVIESLSRKCNLIRKSGQYHPMERFFTKLSIKTQP